MSESLCIQPGLGIIAGRDKRFGTVGAIVKKIGSDHLYLLSSRHVIRGSTTSRRITIYSQDRQKIAIYDARDSLKIRNLDLEIARILPEFKASNQILGSNRRLHNAMTPYDRLPLRVTGAVSSAEKGIVDSVAPRTRSKKYPIRILGSLRQGDSGSTWYTASLPHQAVASHSKRDERDSNFSIGIKLSEVFAHYGIHLYDERQAHANATILAAPFNYDVIQLTRQETFGQVAKRYGISTRELEAINPQLTSMRRLEAGQPLNVPYANDWHLEDTAANSQTSVPWYAAAQNELQLNVAEQPGKRHNPRILEYHRSTTLRAGNDETPWCSSFVCWCMEQAGIESTQSAAARSWLNWGYEIEDAREGAIAVFRRGKKSWQGHVGFVVSETPSYINLLGGNQNNSVSVARYSKSKLISIRWIDSNLSKSLVFASAQRPRYR